MNTALVLIDLQFDFLDPEGQLPIHSEHTAPLLDAVNELVEHAHRAQMPVGHIVNAFAPGSWLNVFRRHAAIDGTPGAQLDARSPKPAPAEPTFTKSSGSAFDNPELGAWLKAQRIDHLIVAGVFANGCVRQSTLAALHAGFAVSVVPEALGDGSDRSRDRGIRRMVRAGARRLSITELLSDQSEVGAAA